MRTSAVIIAVAICALALLAGITILLTNTGPLSAVDDADNDAFTQTDKNASPPHSTPPSSSDHAETPSITTAIIARFDITSNHTWGHLKL